MIRDRVSTRIASSKTSPCAYIPSAAQRKFLSLPSTLSNGDDMQSRHDAENSGIVEVQKSFVEGHDGTLLSVLRYAFAIVSDPINVDTDNFKLSDLSHFIGGDASASSREEVMLNFFNNSKRILLVYFGKILFNFI